MNIAMTDHFTFPLQRHTSQFLISMLQEIAGFKEIKVKFAEKQQKYLIIVHFLSECHFQFRLCCVLAIMYFFLHEAQ